MTVAVKTNSNTYNGNGLTTAFGFNFYCTDTNWVAVFVNGVVVAPSSVVLNIDQSSAPGGTVHMAVAPPPGVGNVFIQRQVPLTQSFNYIYLDAFPATSHMGALDKLTAITQDLQAALQTAGAGLPTPYVPGYVLGATTPTALAWVPQTGGGGGSLPSMIGQAGHVLTNDGLTTAQWTLYTPVDDGLNPLDFGAKMDGTIDDAPALQTTINAALPNPALYPLGGAVRLPKGSFYLGQPLCITAAPLASKQASGLTMNGAGKHVTWFRKHPTQTFQGPLIMVNAPGGYTQGFTTGLVGGGQALVFSNYPSFSGSQIILSDSTAMSFRDIATGSLNMAQFSFQTNLQWHLPSPGNPANYGYIANSYGSFNGNISQSFGLKLHTDFTGAETGQLEVILKTENNNVALSSITVLAQNTTYNVEISYDGAHVGLWIDGVLEANAVATGMLDWKEWESFTLGSVYYALEGEAQIGFAGTVGFEGTLDSVRISNTARHAVGGGNFTPPVTKYTFDNNTLFLLNCDQGTSNYGFVIAQGPAPVAGGFVAGTPVKHYCRFQSQAAVDWTLFGLNLKGFAIDGGWTQPGLVNNGQILSRWEEIYVLNPYRWGVRCGSSYNSFYNYFDHFHIEGGQSVLAAFDCSQTSGHFRNFIISTGSININGGSGDYENMDLQANAGMLCNVRTSGPGGLFSGAYFKAMALDNEVPLTSRWQSSVVFEGGCRFLNFQSCSFLAGGSPSPTPIITYKAGDIISGVFENCLFVGTTTYAFQNQLGQSPPSANPLWEPFVLRDCNVTLPTGSLSDFPEAVRVELDGAQTLVKSISASNIAGGNLAGVASVRHGFSGATVSFVNHEPDTDYVLNFQVRDVISGPAAAGSTTVTGYTRSTTGFSFTVGADPGGTAIVNFGWTLIRIERDALLDEPVVPALPTTFTNPLASPPYQTGDWAVGLILEQVVGTAFRYDSGTAKQIIAAAGAGVLNANSWSVGLQFSGGINGAVATSDGFALSAAFDSAVVNGELGSLLSPGAHNITYGVQSKHLLVHVDGVLVKDSYLPAFLPGLAGIQQTPLHVGEDVDASSPLTSANVRSIRMDTLLRKVTYTDPDIGPAPTVNIGYFIGDDFTKGLQATVNGGFATQIAEARYPNPYYWFGVRHLLTSDVALSEFWNDFGAHQTLAGLCILVGFQDLLGTNPIGPSPVTAVQVWANIQRILNGTPANVTMTPPSNNAYAWAGWVPPERGIPGTPGDTATCVINGTPFTFTVTGVNSTLTDLNTLSALINLDAGITAILNVVVDTGTPGLPYLHITAKAPGFAGNGIPTATNGAHGAYWYPGPSTFGGANATLDLNGRHFDFLFDTDANTTVNNAIILMLADAPTAAAFNVSGVSSRLYIESKTPGIAGNTIPCATNTWAGAALISPETAPLSGATHLAGGRNGAIQNGVPQIVLCNIPPFGQAAAYNPSKDTERVALNALINAFVGAGVTVADVDTLLRDPGNHAHINPAFLSGIDNTYLNDAGHTALFGLINPLLP